MRTLMILSVLALAACNENAGWNPNYNGINANTPYGQYLREREVALHGKGAVPKVIPVVRPVQAPTAEEIVGTARQKAPGTVTVKAGAVKAAPAAPVVQSGPYPGSTPVLVRYAHAEQQAPGTATYRRASGSVDAAARACRSYASAEAAQTAFLAAGGPVIDPRGLDPDGDGFVCGWDPRPYRQSQL